MKRARDTAIILATGLFFVIFLLVIYGDRPVSDRTRQVAARVQIQNFLRALENYKTDVGDYPSQEQGLRALVVNPGLSGWKGPYLRDRNIQYVAAAARETKK
jgi:type II secretory pathway pseudopilin PulG